MCSDVKTSGRLFLIVALVAREKKARQHGSTDREGLVITKRNSEQMGWSRWDLYSYR